MTSSPLWDDPKIPDEEWLYRRVLIRPDFFTQFDVLTNERKLSRAAFVFDDDGMSVYRHSLVEHHCLSWEDVRRSPSYALYRFVAGEARKYEAGVVDDPDLDDVPIGVAHASVRCHPEIKPPAAKRRAIQNALIEASELFEEPDAPQDTLVTYP